MRITRLTDKWSQLNDTVTGEGRTYAVAEVGALSKDEPVLLAVDGGGCRHVFIEVLTDRDIVEDKKSSGVQVLAHKLTDGSRTRRYVDLACRKPHLNDLFDVLAADALDECATSTDPADVVCVRVLEQSRELFDRALSEGLSANELTGLFAELVVLKRATIIDRRAIAAWRGPDRHQHDFAGDSLAIEVKATLRRKGRLLQINGIQQLESPPDSELYLYFTRLVTGGTKGRNLGQSIEDILALGVSSERLFQKLAQAGYLQEHMSRYEELRFEVTEERMYRVDKIFPKITDASFIGHGRPNGVIDLTYVIDLSAEPPVPLNSEEAADVLTRLAQA